MQTAANPSRLPVRLTGSDLRAALDALQSISEASASTSEFARSGLACLPRLVGSELTTLSICDLDSGHRAVVSDQPGAISPGEIAVFDHYFYDHPLVRDHGRNPRAVTKRIVDLLPDGRFEDTPLYNDYYRPIRIDHVMAVPIHVDGRFLVSFVLNRSRRCFSDRDRGFLDLLRPHLGSLYRLSLATGAAGRPEPAAGAAALPASQPVVTAAALGLPVTGREREVLRWVASGKTDRDIADILGISPRTVHKHLQHIYEKLGVETRTAAVMRALGGYNRS